MNSFRKRSRGAGLARPAAGDAFERMARELIAAASLTKRRQSGREGRTCKPGCGQLRARTRGRASSARSSRFQTFNDATDRT